MKLGQKVTSVIKKYEDENYFESVPKYVLKHDLENIGIDVKPCFDLDVLKGIMKVLLDRVDEV